MGAFRAELIKLKRSLSWPVVVILPIALVLAGAATQLARRETPEDGWNTVWVQSVVFYGLFPLAVGVAILASLAWRPEHHGSNWNALMSGPTPSLSIIVAKSTVIAGLTAIMQLILLLSVLTVGKLFFGLPGLLPAQYLGVIAILCVSIIPLAVLQSTLSMMMRSFAAPIAVALAGAGVSVFLVMLGSPIALASPYGLAIKATQLGTGTFADTGTITFAEVSTILIAAIVLTTILLALTTRVLERKDTRV